MLLIFNSKISYEFILPQNGVSFWKSLFIFFFFFKLIFVFQISAQESRRKKKEYMDSLERKYDIMQSEANSWKSKAEALQAQNAALAKQVTELQQKLNMATKTGSEISFILPESIDLEDNLLQGEPSTLSKQLKKHDENICL